MGNCSRTCYEFIWGADVNTHLNSPVKPNYWRIGTGNHKIVVGIGAKDFEGSKKSLNFAFCLANQGDEVAACHVRTNTSTADMTSRLKELENAHAAEIKSKNIQFETTVAQGNPRHELLRKSLDADMLIVGAGHKGFGSMTRFACEHAKVNVVVVKKEIKEAGKILVAIGANDLYGSLSALKLAFDIANSGEHVTALHIPVSTNVSAGEWKMDERVRRKSSIKSFEAGRKANEVIRAVRERADSLIKSFGEEGKKVKFNFEYKEGEFDRTAVRTELMSAAKSARLVVMGSGRKGFGSVARYIVENLQCCPIVLAKFVRAQSQTCTDTDV